MCRLRSNTDRRAADYGPTGGRPRAHDGQSYYSAETAELKQICTTCCQHNINWRHSATDKQTT
eukprot:5450865-Pyramimonas_sp.AAC.1